MNDIFNIDILREEIFTVLLLGLWSFVLAMTITPVYTWAAYRYKWWKKPRTQALTGEKSTIFTKLHDAKHRRNIPTMAGLIMLVAITVTTLVFNLSREQTYLPLAATVGAGLVGLLDDVINLRGGTGIAGLNSRLKFILIFSVAAAGAFYFYYKLGFDAVHVPFVTERLSTLTVGWLLIPLFILVVVMTANAVNISDGLDGLAGGLLVNAFAAYAFIAFLQGNYGIAGFCMTIVWALLAYVWFNIFPARFFMGDVGSFALGTALGVVAMLTDTLLLLPVIGFVFVIEGGSSLVQVFWKRIFGRKLFKVAPIHHHFEALGWPETKVTMRFWVIGQVAGVVGVVLALVGGHV